MTILHLHYGAKTHLSHWQRHLVTHKDKLEDSEDIKTDENQVFSLTIYLLGKT